MTKNLNFDWVLDDIYQMKALFLHFFDVAEHSGISKKIFAQINALRLNGVETDFCHLKIDSDGVQRRVCGDIIIDDFGNSYATKFIKWFKFKNLTKFILDNNYDLLYIRSFYNTSPQLLRMLNNLNRAGVKVVIEFPTYPYDSEIVGAEIKIRLISYMNRILRHRLSKYVHRAITFSEAQAIHGIKTIQISNGIEFESIKLKERLHTGSVINLIGVAEVHLWHGYDRVIYGLADYYSVKRDVDVVFNIVGDGDTRENERLKSIVKRLNMEKYIIFSGYLAGRLLDEAFDNSHFGIASLARHRTNISVIKTLKNREYAARGIPFIYSENDSDFDNMPYVIKAIADDTPINISDILEFLRTFRMDPSEIRESIIDKLSWKIQMQKVVDNL